MKTNVEKMQSPYMSVVDKIDKMGYEVYIRQNKTMFSNVIEELHPGYSMIEVTYLAVVNFIKWHNKPKV